MPDPTTTTTVDPTEARKSLDQAKQTIQTNIGATEDQHWRIGKTYAGVVASGWPQAVGYKSAHEFVTKELANISQASLTEYGAVAGAFPESTATQYGMTKLGDLLTLAHLAQLPQPLPADPAQVDVQTSDKKGGPVTKKFADCSRAELLTAIKLLKAPTAALSAADAATVDSLQQALDKLLGAHTVAHAKGHKRATEVLVDLSNLPVQKIKDVLQALLAVAG